MRHRNNLITIYQVALEAVNGRNRVKAALSRYDLQKDLYVAAIGKAAAAMFRGAEDAVSASIKQSLVITKTDYVDALVPNDNLRIIEAGHPWPTTASLEAGSALLDFIDHVPEDGQLLFLISGGASSLAEVLPEGVGLEELHRLNDWLLSSGLDIHAINHVRKAVSCIKGGRLAQKLNDRSALALLISDVPGDDPATIGSGLLVPDRFVEKEVPLQLPAWIEELISKGPPMPERDSLCFDHVTIDIIATINDAKHAAAAKGRDMGYEVYEDGASLVGDAVLVGQQLAMELIDGPAGLYIWGGETTVQLPANPGQGGRNQQLALSAAIELQGEEDIVFLAAGSDGTDGPTDDAGGIVDGGSMMRGKLEGLNAKQCLTQADAGTFLSASGDLIQTGLTGTNVMDIMLGLKTIALDNTTL